MFTKIIDLFGAKLTTGTKYIIVGVWKQVRVRYDKLLGMSFY